MRNYEETIREAELLARTPEAVADYLKERAGRIQGLKIWSIDGDEGLEKALLARSHPLIDLALAKYCYYDETAQALFTRQPGIPALRLAVLSNQVLASAPMAFFPLCIFGRDKSEVPAFLAGASDEELCALFSNPYLHDSFLRHFLEGDEGWEALSERGRQLAVMMLARNVRMKAPYDYSVIDGYADYSYHAVFDAAWSLAESAPSTSDWASALNSLFEQVLPHSSSMKQPLEVASRWFAQDQAALKREAENNAIGFLADFQGVRQGLARLALKYHRVSPTTLLESDDIAFRVAAYANADLEIEQISAASERDGKLAFEGMVRNPQLWIRQSTREALQGVAKAVDDNDSNASLDGLNTLRALEERFFEEHPEWFKDDARAGEALSGRSATKGDIEELASSLSPLASGFEHLRAKLEAGNSRLGTVGWFSIGVLVGAISRLF